MEPEPLRPSLGAFLLALAASWNGAPQDGAPIWERHVLSLLFLCEGAAIGDVDGDGRADLVAGPFVYLGPDFARRIELHAPGVHDPRGYSDSFLQWVHDVDGDGRADVVEVGFPGRELRWYRNPGPGEGPWERFVVFHGVDGESPAFVDLTGDGAREIVCNHGGRFGWIAPEPGRPREPWSFHPISEDLGLPVFLHGLGVGDIDGDGRADLIERGGWWRQPESLEGDPAWVRRPHDFAAGRRGGAQMLVTDVNGNGLADVVTSLDAHGWGLSWFEQVREGTEISFREHRVLDERDPERPGAFTFSQPHALALGDVDGDGVPDVVTGKRHWAHGPAGDPEPGAPAVVVWLRVERGSGPGFEGGARLVPRVVDDDSGAGTQLAVGDVDGDGRLDVLVANKKGAHLFLQRPPGWRPEAAEGDGDGDGAAGSGPGGDDGGLLPRGDDGRPLNLDFETGDLGDWTAEGEAFRGQPVRGDTVHPRRSDSRSRHQGRYWIGGYELAGDGPTGTLTSIDFTVTHPWASFLVGGGAHLGTAVELWFEGEERAFLVVPGTNREDLQRVTVDLGPYQGRRIRIRLVDRHGGHWGHVNFDDFRFHAERPAAAPNLGFAAPEPLVDVPHAGLAPEEAARAMTVPAGFVVELVAGEPDLHQPIAMAIDSRGRVWVAEAFSYPTKRPEGEGQDRIVVFEDAAGEGTRWRRTEFLSGLNLVSGLEVGFGGVWIGAAPELLFVPDADGDLVPDGPARVVLDGWGYQDTHETLNSFTWGPDGWLYGCHGVFTHSQVGAPGTPEAQRAKLNAGLWRYHPTKERFEVFAWGTSNPWGVAFDGRGQAFVTACVIPHVFHLVQGGRYHRQAGEPFEPWVYEGIRTIADHRHYAGEVGDHAWWGRNEPVHARSTLEAGGGHAHCGAHIYLGTAFPAEYRGALLMGNIHGNRLNLDLLERQGSGFVARHGPDFLLANDQWFRPIACEEGSDGALYLIDWYDGQACHRTDVELWDRTNGRLFRVAHGEPRPARGDLGRLDSEALVGLVGDRDGWAARHARRLLQERGPDPAVHAALARVLDGSPEPRRRLEALWALHATGGLSRARALELLDHPDEDLRAWSVQLALEDRAPSERLLARLAALARDDPSAVVRLYLASALQRLEPDSRWELGAALAGRAEDGDDPNLAHLVWFGLAPLVELDPARALALAEGAALARVAGWIARRAAQLDGARDELVAALGRARGEWLAALLAEAARALEDRRGLRLPAGWDAVHARLAAHPDAGLREQAFALAVAFGDRSVFPDLRATLADPAAEAGRRRRALEALERGRDPASVPILLELLDEPDLGPLVLRALASFDDGRVPAAILGAYVRLDAEARADALATLAQRPVWALELLAAVEEGRVPRGDLDALVLRRLSSLGDERVEARRVRLFGVARESSDDVRGRIAEWQAKLTPEVLAAADPVRGRAVYRRTCEQCHVLYGVGNDVGPDITGSNRADLEYLLTNLFDPNAVIPPEYQETIVLTWEDRVLTGILVAESETEVVLRSTHGTVVIDREEIQVQKASGVSMMPEGQLDVLGEEEARDLIAYLVGSEQVPRLAERGDERVLFDGLSLNGWSGDPAVWSVEEGAIVGRGRDLTRNSFLVGELLLEDFRLVVEVRLTGGLGNSGIQFRSRPLAGAEVAGPQADIGPGWWGKLYEEHGRGLLEAEGCADAVLADDWNTYEILAVGTRVRTALNGRLCVDRDDPELARRGVLALQVHAGAPTEVRFRALRLELDPEPRLVTAPAPGGAASPGPYPETSR